MKKVWNVVSGIENKISGVERTESYFIIYDAMTKSVNYYKLSGDWLNMMCLSSDGKRMVEDNSNLNYFNIYFPELSDKTKSLSTRIHRFNTVNLEQVIAVSTPNRMVKVNEKYINQTNLEVAEELADDYIDNAEEDMIFFIRQGDEFRMNFNPVYTHTHGFNDSTLQSIINGLNRKL